LWALSPSGFVSIASAGIHCWGGSAANENRAYLMDWYAVQSRPQDFNCASTHSAENAHYQPWFSFFLRRTEHFFPSHYKGVSYAEWPEDEHE
jgi:hypothetical protein